MLFLTLIVHKDSQEDNQLSTAKCIYKNNHTTVFQILGWSNLVISNSQLFDSGNYSCQPNNALPDTVNIHVLTGNISCLVTPLSTLVTLLDSTMVVEMAKFISIPLICNPENVLCLF